MAPIRPVGLVIALDVEARCLGVATPGAGTIVAVGEDALIVRTGIGALRAGDGARALLAAGAAGLVSFGTAAALDAATGAGTLLLPDGVLGADGRVMRTDREWRGRLRARLGPAHDASLLAECESVLAQASDKARLHDATGAAACDMESAAIGRAAAEAGVPLLILRAVADDARTSLPACALAAMDDDGRLRVGRCLRGLAREPGALAALISAARGFGAARRTLRRAARLAGAEIGVASAAG